MRKSVFFNKIAQLVIVVALITAFFPSGARAGQFSQALSGHVPSAIARFHLQPLHNLPATNVLNLAISLPLQNESALNELLNRIYDPASANYHHYLTPEQFNAQFGPSPQDYDAVIQFARSNGLTVINTYSNRTLIDVSSDVATAERVFHTTLRVYQHPVENRTFFAPDTEPVLDLGVPVSHITGLDNFTIPHPALIQENAAARPAGAKPASGSGPDGLYMGNDFHAAYAPGVTLNGSGQTVALFELDGYYTNDIISYEQQAGLPSTTLTNVAVNGGVRTPGNGDGEVSLDIEMDVSMATNLSRVIVYEAPNGGGNSVIDLLSRIASDNLAKQISSSWLVGDNSSYDTYYKQMASQGQSFFQASGDNGAYYSDISEWADDTNITLVGGTTLYTANGAYSSESAWNWLITDPPNAAATGGGINFNNVPIPTWQQGVSMANNQGSTTLRNVPDVALTADNIYVIYNNGSSEEVGGTSCAAPLWAAFTAMINQQARSLGDAYVGFINPAVYAIGKSASYTNDFHDITTGNNTNATVLNQWFAVPGYDLCTGWGTPNGQNLINALAPSPNSLVITPATGFSTSGFAGGPFTPTSQNYVLSNSAPSSLQWSLINTSSWLDVSITGGDLPVGAATNVTLSLDPNAANLVAGNYNTTVTFTNSASNLVENVQFTLQVTEPLVVTPAAGFAVATAEGGPFSASQIFSLTNAGSATVSWQVAGSSWLNFSPSSGTLPGGAVATVTATFNSSAANLAPGAYTGHASFTDEASGLVQTRQFTLSVGQNIVQNGGFETGAFSPWTLYGETIVYVDKEEELYNGVVDASTFSIATNFIHSGTYGAALGQSGYLAYLSQSVSTLPGQNYLLSFWLNNFGGSTPNQFQVNWNTNAAATNTVFNQVNVSTINNWTNMLFTLTATGTNTVLQFGAENDNYYFGLDDITLTPIPSPNIRGFSKVSNSALSLTWYSLSNLTYEVQYSTNLASTNWFNLNTYTAANSTISVTNPIGTNSSIFYRVLRLP